MADVVSIVIAVLSLVGSVAAIGLTAWMSLLVDRVKQRSEAKHLTSNKFRDPLTLASFELQSRLWGIVQINLLSYSEDEDKKDLVYTYTTFLVGQYLSWTWILRRQAMFLGFISNKAYIKLNQIIDRITYEFAQDRVNEDAFMLWRGQQVAIGELMTVREENGELYCIGYAGFSEKYHKDPEFKKWFKPVETGIGLLVDARAEGNNLANNRLRRIQHLLVDLTILLYPHQVDGRQLKVEAANDCRCNKCPGVMIAESPSIARTSHLPEP